MESKELTIIIVTFKSEDKIFGCLKSISNEIPIIVVENSDNHIFKNRLEENFPNVKCVLTGENKGYAAANNIGLKLIKTKYGLVLNPDTIVGRDAIKSFFISAQKQKDFWLIGPANDQMVKLNFNENNLKEVEYLRGFAIFFNIKMFKNKFFDENFFLYWEEIDLCKRVKKNGGTIFLDKNIIINHEGANSVNKTNIEELEKSRNWHWMWSTFYFHKKYKGFFAALIMTFPKIISAIFKSLFYFLIFNKQKGFIYLFRLRGLFNSMIGKKSWYRPALD